MSLPVIKPSWCLKAFGFVSPKCPHAICGAAPFSTDLLSFLLWPMSSSPEIIFEKGNFCVAVKFMSGFETQGINSAVVWFWHQRRKALFLLFILYSCI